MNDQAELKQTTQQSSQDERQGAAPQAEQEVPVVPPERKARDPVRKWFTVVLALFLLLFVYHLVSDRLTPYTSDAFVQAFLVRIAPEVAGTVIEVEIQDNQRVDQGQVLFRIDPDRFETAVESSEAALAKAGQNIGASTAQVAAAQARLAETKARLANVREQTARVFELVNSGIYAKARGDAATAALETAKADVDRATADLEEARQNLGPKGEANPDIRKALADLERARLDLIRTTVKAPSEGLITNLQLTTGQYAAVGQPVMTFIDIRSVWIIANMRENNLGNLKAGDRAEVVLDVRPGRIFDASVESISWGIDPGQTDSLGELPTIQAERGWLPEAQHFPVRLEFAGEARPKGIRFGSRARVIVYTGDHPIMNALGWLWIRSVGLMSYVY